MQGLSAGSNFRANIVRAVTLWEVGLHIAGDIPWDPASYTGIDQLGRDTDATPIDVPLHPGAAQWYREQGFIS